mgnify:FL=1
MDTIAAVATGRGEAAIGIVRLSGPDAIEITGRFIQSGVPLHEVPARQAIRARATDSPSPYPLPVNGERGDKGLPPVKGEVSSSPSPRLRGEDGRRPGEGVFLDDVVVTVWRAPASYTGEDMV